VFLPLNCPPYFLEDSSFASRPSIDLVPAQLTAEQREFPTGAQRQHISPRELASCLKVAPTQNSPKEGNLAWLPRVIFFLISFHVCQLPSGFWFPQSPRRKSPSVRFKLLALVQSISTLISPVSASRVGYLSRKALPIKRNDAEPLTREDVQYDLLDYLFTDKRAAFTDPFSNKRDKVTFGDLYINAVYNSNKCSKVLKERMADTPAFGIEFAKIALLTNVGRINTTMACKEISSAILQNACIFN
jgi:hypothetical protein